MNDFKEDLLRERLYNDGDHRIYKNKTYPRQEINAKGQFQGEFIVTRVNQTPD